MSDSESVTVRQNGSDKCSMSTVVATGTFKTNGSGGTVRYEWIRKDSSGTSVISEAPIAIAAGDTATHNVVQDQWGPASSGSEQLAFLSPSAPGLAAQAFSCR